MRWWWGGGGGRGLSLDFVLDGSPAVGSLARIRVGGAFGDSKRWGVASRELRRCSGKVLVRQGLDGMVSFGPTKEKMTGKKKKQRRMFLGFGNRIGIGYTHCLRDRLSCEEFHLLLDYARL